MFVACGSCVVWLQHVADLGSGLQSAQQSQLAVTERLDRVAMNCSTMNDTVIASLNARLNNMQTVINETLVSNCCSLAPTIHF